MSSWATEAELVLAVSDLRLVELLRSAIAVADIQSGLHKPGPVQTTVKVEREPTRRVDEYVPSSPPPRDGYCHTRCCHHGHAAHFKPHPPEPRLALEPRPAPGVPPPPATEFRIEPPWRVLPWKEPSQPPPKIKIVHYRPDIRHKGTLLDYFV